MLLMLIPNLVLCAFYCIVAFQNHEFKCPLDFKKFSNCDFTDINWIKLGVDKLWPGDHM